MRAILIAFALAATACAAVTTGAKSVGEQPAEKAALARRYTDLVNVPGLIESRFRSFADEMLASVPDINAACANYPDASNCRRTGAAVMVDVNRALDAAVANVGDYLEVLKREQAAAYADIYTTEELAAAVAFAESPAGRSIRLKAPQVAKRLNDSEYALLRPWMDDLRQSMEDIYKKYGYTFEQPADAI